MCVGELHGESARSILSKEVFADLSADVLMLESTHEQLTGLIKRMQSGRDYFALLGADIMNILRTAGKMIPDFPIFGIEETGKQAENGHGQSNFRDQAIAKKFWGVFEPGLRHIILFGALHCSNEPDWLFNNLCSRASPALKPEMLNVLVLGDQQYVPVEAFVYFLDEMGIKKSSFVIPDVRSLPDFITNWFSLPSQQRYGTYRSLIIFRS